MVTWQDLQTRELVTLYQLREYSYEEGAGGTALSCGCSEPKDEKEVLHGIFASNNGKVTQRLDDLVQQRISEGYSKPNVCGGEQCKVERDPEKKRDNRIFCTSIGLKQIEIEKKEIQEANNNLMYQEFLIE